VYNPMAASLRARREYWRRVGVGGNRVDAQREADVAWNQAVEHGPASWKAAYPLRGLIPMTVEGDN
jgi:hypothetical protein